MLSPTDLPPVLIVNAGVRTSDELEFWIDGRQGSSVKFLERSFSIARPSGDSLAISSPAATIVGEGAAIYELRVSPPLTLTLVVPSMTDVYASRI